MNNNAIPRTNVIPEAERVTIATDVAEHCGTMAKTAAGIVIIDANGETITTAACAATLLESGDFQAKTDEDQQKIDEFLKRSVATANGPYDPGVPVMITVPEFAGRPPQERAVSAPDGTRFTFDEEGTAIVGDKTAAAMQEAIPSMVIESLEKPAAEDPAAEGPGDMPGGTPDGTIAGANDAKALGDSTPGTGQPDPDDAGSDDSEGAPGDAGGDQSATGDGDQNATGDGDQGETDDGDTPDAARSAGARRTARRGAN